MEITTNEKTGIVLYANLLSDIKTRIRRAQVKATLSANAEMIMMYCDIGSIIYKRQQQEGWGAGIIPRLSKDLHNELPDVKGFSERNIQFMIQFYKEYGADAAIGKQPVSQSGNMKQLVSQIPWGHNILLMQRVKDNSIRFWHTAQIIRNGWSRDTLWGINKPIDLPEYKLTRAPPENLRSSLPSIEALEAELSGIHQENKDERFTVN